MNDVHSQVVSTQQSEILQLPAYLLTSQQSDDPLYPFIFSSLLPILLDVLDIREGPEEARPKKKKKPNREASRLNTTQSAAPRLSCDLRSQINSDKKE